MKTLNQTWTHAVRKDYRGMQGEWCRHPARRFASEAEALAYAESFAADQVRVLGPGIRIVIIDRAARTTRTFAGGKL
jgi:hypothetical protein